jgi:hypothetical protein
MSSSATSSIVSSTPIEQQGKRGLLYNDAKFTKNFGGSGSKVSWASNWNYNRYLNDKMALTSDGQFNPDLEFVPQLWNVSTEDQFHGFMGSAKSTGNAAAVKNFLAFNEPNQCGGGGTCMTDHTDLLVQSYNRTLQPHGKTAKLVSPSVTNGPDGILWLQKFIEQCSQCQIDAVQVHWYGGGMDDFKPYIEKFHNAFRDKKIWLTEFALDENADPSPKTSIDFLKNAMKFLDDTEYVERYAWFMAAPLDNARALVKADGSLTEIGKLYNSG